MEETTPMDPKEHLLRKATPQRLGVRADLCNTYIQTERGSQNEETEKKVSNERTKRICRKRAT